MNDQPDDLDLSKPLSRWNAPHWAMRNGIAAALKSDARWAVLEALFTYLPNVRPGKDAIESMTGLSRASVWRATKALKAVGLINYDDQNRGGYRLTNQYVLADIRRPEVVKAVLEVIAKPSHGDTVSPLNGLTMKQKPSHGETKTVSLLNENRLTMSPEVLNRSTQSSSQVSTQEGPAVAVLPSSPASPATSKAEEVRRTVPTASKRSGKLTDEQKVLLCSSPDAMTAWFCFGWPAVGKSQADWSAAGPPSQTNWAPRSGDYSQPESDVDISALAAWAWIKISHARGSSGLPVTLPNLSKLIGVVKPISDRMTRQQLIDHVIRVTDRWPEIQSPLGRFGQSLILDETILAVPQVLAQSERLAAGQNLTQNNQPVSPLLEKPDFSKRSVKYAHAYAK
jgi:biotin operon repressor